MSIYGQSGQNPAKALYNYWLSVLKPIGSRDPLLRAVTFFGTERNFGIGTVRAEAYELQQDSKIETLHPSEYGTQHHPVLGFGYMSWGGRSVLPMFKLTHKGEFQLCSRPHGDNQRQIIAAHTFLDWRYQFSRIMWLVNTEHRRYGSSASDLGDWRNPVHYIDQRAMCSGHLVPPVWLKLESVDGSWKIVFSRSSELPAYKRAAWNGGPTYAHRTQADFDAFEDLRLKRYARLQRRDLLASGVVVPKGRRIVSSAEINERLDRQASVLADHLQVRVPPRSKPMKRTLEGK